MTDDRLLFSAMTECTSPCVIGGLDPLIEYNFTVIQSNSCGSAAGCTGTNSTAETPSECVPHNINLDKCHCSMLMTVLVSLRLVACLHKFCMYIHIYTYIYAYYVYKCTVYVVEYLARLFIQDAKFNLNISE